MSDIQVLTSETFEDNRIVTKCLLKSGDLAPQAEKLKALIKTLVPNGSFTIIVAQVDPDAIGSAWGMLEILRLCGVTEVNVAYAGKVAHPQNEALCNKFGLLGQMVHITKLTPETIGQVILVDSNRAMDSRLPFKVDPVIVVDHHRDSDILNYEGKFILLDESAGSASTLVLELLAELIPEGWEFRGDLAILLAIGVYTDTKDMLAAGSRDRESFNWAAKYANNHDLRDLIRYKRRDSFYKNFATALRNIKHKHGSLVTTVGRIPAKQGDDLSMIADELLRKNGVTLSIVWGIVESKNDDTAEVTKGVRVSARCEDITLNLSEFLKERFGQSSGAKLLPDGIGEGGAYVPLVVGPWLREEDMPEIVSRRINSWIFDEQPGEDDV